MAYQRIEHLRLPSGVELRDQKPMPSAALERCLVGMTPGEWYETVNARVFFRIDPERLNRQRRAWEPREQVVLTIDAHRLLTAYGDRASFTPINTGNARRSPAKRGLATYVAYHEWLASGWDIEADGLRSKPRARSHAPVELAIEGAIPDILAYVTQRTALAPGVLFDLGIA